MPVNLQDAIKQLNALNFEIERTVKNYGQYADEVEFNVTDPDEAFIYSEVREITGLLQDANEKINYLNKPVVNEGVISHNSSGRYELPNGDYFTSGSVCEIYIHDEFWERNTWIYTRIEHNGTDYYATALGTDVSIDGKLVRIRR